MFSFGPHLFMIYLHDKEMWINNMQLSLWHCSWGRLILIAHPIRGYNILLIDSKKMLVCTIHIAQAKIIDGHKFHPFEILGTLL